MSSLACPCLNIVVTVEDGPLDDGDILQEALEAANQLKRCVKLQTKYPCLTQHLNVDETVQVTKCVNCNILVLARATDAYPCTVAVNRALLGQEAQLAAQAKASSVFHVVVPPAEQPLTPLSPPSYFAADPSSPYKELSDHLHDAIRDHRIQIERQIAALRKQLAEFSGKANAEAQILATKAGYQRGSFSDLKDDEVPTPPAGPILAQSTNADLDVASSLRLQSSFPSFFRPRSVSDAPSRDPPKDKDTPRKVTFADPEPQTTEEVDLGSSEVPDEDARHESAVFDFDEDFGTSSEHAAQDNLEGHDSTEPLSPAADYAAALRQARSRSTSASYGDPSLGSAPFLSEENRQQLLKLQDLLGRDMPSHRHQQVEPSAVPHESTSRSPEEHNEDDEAREHVFDLARSLPVPISYGAKDRRSSATQKYPSPNPDAHRQTIPPSQSTATEEEIHRQLIEATGRALSASLASRPIAHSIPPEKKEPLSRTTPSMLIPKDYFAPTTHERDASSFRPSSLTAALATLPASKIPRLETQAPVSAEEGKPAQDRRETGTQEFDGEEPNFFLPPHLWVRMSRAGDGLLSTSVHV